MRSILIGAATVIAAIAGGCASSTNEVGVAPAEVQVTQSAPALAGQWHGPVSRPSGARLRIGFVFVESTPGQYTGTAESPDAGSPRTPLADVVLTGEQLSFSVPATRASFAGAWNAATGKWVGEYRHPAGNSPLELAAGPVPPAPPLVAVKGLDGRWEGRVQGAMPVVLRVKTDGAGTIAHLDMPGQAMNVPLTALTRDGSQISFTIAALAMNYQGALAEDATGIAGTVSMPGQALPLAFGRTAIDAGAATELVRPQTPRKPYPYSEQEVAFDNPAAAGVKLACSLTTPSTPGPHPAAVLLSGSGPHDRDATVLGHKTFLVLSDHLTRAGIAVLRCDDRGVARSTGNFATATLADFASDGEAALAFLRMRQEIDPKRIGLIGHSLGTMIAQRVVAKDRDVAFVVMLAAAGAPGREISIDQQQAMARADGMSEAYLASSGALWRKVVALVNSNQDNAAVRAAVFELLKTEGPSAYPTGMSEAAAKAEAERVSSDYVRGLQAFDPAVALKDVRTPILAINGSLDVQATPSLNLGGLRRILAGYPDATIIEMPGLNHAFQTAKTGAMSEYAEIEETFAPKTLDVISDWLKQRLAR